MIVLDTNVVSELARPVPSAKVTGWLNERRSESLFLTSVTVAELRFGAKILPHGARRDGYLAGIDALESLFDGRILAFDTAAARIYGDLAARGRQTGRPLSVSDGYIAAIALARGFAVATRNTTDFESTGVRLIDPWQD